MTKFNKIFPWYAGLSGDLLFWVALEASGTLSIPQKWRKYDEKESIKIKKISVGILKIF